MAWTLSMCFLLDVVLFVLVPFLFMLLPFLSPEQYLRIVLIVYSFALGLEPSYLDKKGKLRGCLGPSCTYAQHIPSELNYSSW